MKFIFLALSLLSVSFCIFSQSASFKVWIELADKNDNPFKIDEPEAFLSQKAIDRRLRQHISIKQNDLPVNPSYVEQVKVTGATVRHQSKWFNALSLELADSAVLADVLALPFVTGHQKVAKFSGKRNQSYLKLETSLFPIERINTSKYGIAFNQISMLKGEKLHQRGLFGQSMTIAVMDAGFTNVDVNRAFDTLRQHQRILGAFDMVSGGKDVYDKHGHGTSVLSVMAGNIPFEFIGVAPEASYYLFRTEDGATELLVEEDNWIAAAEKADSLGVDVFNTSLGYTQFQDSTMDHSYSDLDGNTTRITIGADIAASKGILVVNSAGNLGASPWHFISAPADGDSVLAVGAVHANGNVVGFSSRGPSADGDVKPNVCAQGGGVAVVSSGGIVGESNGTSFSGPIIAGLAACLWQAFPNKTNMEIFHAIERSAHLYDDPNDDYGYGIPDFELAYTILAKDLIDVIGTQMADVDVIVFPNPVVNSIHVFLHAEKDETLIISVFDMKGTKIYSIEKYILENSYDKFTIDQLHWLQSGEYVLRIQSSEDIQDVKFSKIHR